MGTIKLQRKNEVIEFGTSRFPDRKRPALIVVRGAQIHVLGYLRDEKSAEVFGRSLGAVVDWFNEAMDEKAAEVARLRKLCRKSPLPIFGADGNLTPAFDRWLDKINAAGREEEI